LKRQFQRQQAAVYAQHDHDAGIFIEALNGNRSASRQQYVAPVLQHRIHGHHQHATCKTSD